MDIKKNKIGFIYPDQEQFRQYLRVMIPSLATFLVVYFSMNWMTSFRSNHYQFYVQQELSMPFVPEMIFAYLSCYLLPLMPLFFLNPRELKVVRTTFISSILVAAIFYILFPAELGFDRSVDKITRYQTLYSTLFVVDLPHNLAPSLHVNIAGLLAFVVANNRPVWFKLVMYGWFALIGISILLTHQHHCIDLITGFLLCFCFYKFYYLKKIDQCDAALVKN